MKRYMKAEWEIYKKNRGNLFMGFGLLFFYMIFLIFTGLMGPSGLVFCTILGNITIISFLLPMYFFPTGRRWGRKKWIVTTEQAVLTLGESKRIFLQIRLIAWGILLLGMVLFSAVMQLPALLIAGKQYRIFYFFVEIFSILAFFFAFLIPICLLSYRYLLLGMSIWAGFSSGVMTSGLTSMAEDGIQEERQAYVAMAEALICFILAVCAFLFRYIRTIREERGRKMPEERS
ncbi:MAG: hypothetical protein J1E35_06695 [Lachnospiraceae bacterium]|nr:hypothetical protein [Lachnospiraceae bacterium]